MATAAETQADPRFQKLSPEAQKIVLSRLAAKVTPPPGAGEARDPVSAALGATGDALGNAVVGAGRTVGHEAVSLGNTVNNAARQVAAPGAPNPDQPAFDAAHEALGENQGVLQKLGGAAARVGTLALPAMAAGPMGGAAAVGAATGGLDYATGGTPGEAVASALTGGLAQKLRMFKAAQGGADALTDLARSNAADRLPVLQDAIDAARAKGAVPGHGRVPSALLDELKVVTQALARGQGAEAAAQKATEMTGDPKVGKALLGFLQHPVTQKLAKYAAGAAAAGAGGAGGLKLLKILMPD